MNSENISIIAMEPFINKFIYTIIKTIRSQNLNYDDRHVIHADLVPKFSGAVMHASLMEKEIPAIKEIEVPKIPKHQYRDMSMLIAPIRRRPVRQAHIQIPAPAQTPPTIASHQMAAVPQKPFEMNRPKDIPPVTGVAPVSGEATLSHDYGKITPLLNDPSVSTIECQGKGKPLMIIRAGMRQVTRIVLSADEIKGILQKISDAIHIPLLEGVFRAAADNFAINAVISEMIGSRFVIKKQTPYSLLERQS